MRVDIKRRGANCPAQGNCGVRNDSRSSTGSLTAYICTLLEIIYNPNERQGNSAVDQMPNPERFYTFCFGFTYRFASSPARQPLFLQINVLESPLFDLGVLESGLLHGESLGDYLNRASLG